MCTAIKYKDCFGRTLDYERGFGEELVRINPGSKLDFIYEGRVEVMHGIVGMAKIFGGVPLFFDGMNDAGLCAAALNFPRYAFYRGARCDGVNLASFELISYVLASCSSVVDVKYKLRSLNLTDDSVSEELSTTQLHWMVADKTESIVIEPLRSGVRLFENEVGVLTNAPSFDYQTTRLTDFMGLSSLPPKNQICNDVSLDPYSRGMGAVGLPGDWSSSSRFVRAVFVKENLDTKGINNVEALFEIARSVSVPRGCVTTERGDSVGTIYTSCMDMTEKKYYLMKEGERSNIKALGFR